MVLSPFLLHAFIHQRGCGTVSFRFTWPCNLQVAGGAGEAVLLPGGLWPGLDHHVQRADAILDLSDPVDERVGKVFCWKGLSAQVHGETGETYSWHQ